MRALFNTVMFVVYTFVGAVLAVLSRLWDGSGDTVLHLARLWARAVLRTTGTRMTIRFEEPLQPGRPYVFISNHLSSVDIWALFHAIPFPVRFIAKKQLAIIPLFGWAMSAGRFIFIDRQNPIAARRSIDEAARRIKSGASVIIFAEGTRSRDGSLLPFKKGGFHLATASGASIVPVAIMGTREVMPRRSPFIRPGNIFVGFGKPIPTEGLGEDDRRALTEQVRGWIADTQAKVRAGETDAAADKATTAASASAQ